MIRRMAPGKWAKRVALGVGLAGLAGAAMAQVEAPPSVDAGNTAWILAATALVLFMTLPGLALFYA
ncbi:MAG: hypothetical protein ACK53I_08635, partial [Phenylobacterium sp.]